MRHTDICRQFDLLVITGGVYPLYMFEIAAGWQAEQNSHTVCFFAPSNPPSYIFPKKVGEHATTKFF
jgi:hypothetical protein